MPYVPHIITRPNNSHVPTYHYPIFNYEAASVREINAAKLRGDYVTAGKICGDYARLEYRGHPSAKVSKACEGVAIIGGPAESGVGPGAFFLLSVIIGVAIFGLILTISLDKLQRS